MSREGFEQDVRKILSPHFERIAELKARVAELEAAQRRSVDDRWAEIVDPLKARIAKLESFVEDVAAGDYRWKESTDLEGDAKEVLGDE